MTTSSEVILGTMSMIAIIVLILIFHAYNLAIKRLDRYRLKHGFDREIEKKVLGRDSDVDIAEKNYKRRTYTD